MYKAKPIPIILSAQESYNFWKYVNKKSGQGPSGNCWEWVGSRSSPLPYGLFSVRRPAQHYTILAHRLAYCLQYVNPNHLCVLHRCDNPPCVRGEHLFLGTDQDNKDDSVAKGRHFRGPRADTSNFTRGERVHCAKLSTNDVAAIIDLQRQGLNATDIYKLDIFPVSRRSIAYILEGQTWKHV